MLRTLALAASLIVAGLAVVTPSAKAQVIEPLRPYDPAVVRVAGRSEVYVQPDEARVRVGFYAPGRTNEEATNAVSERARRLDAAIRGLGRATVTLERTDVTVTPVMRAGGERRPDRVQGYEANANVTILVRDLAALNQVMEIAVNADPDRFDGVAFSVQDTASARRQAREAAIRDAVDKARVYVEGAGFQLGRLLLVEEGGAMMIAQSGNRALFAAPIAAMEGQVVAPPPIAAEPQLYSAEVTVVFEIGAARAR